MKLKKVLYELYDSEVQGILSQRERKSHNLDREIRLEGEADKVIYIFWDDERVQFCVGFDDNRRYQSDPESIIEVTQWPLWKGFIGKEITIKFVEPDNELIELTDGSHWLYFWAGGEGGSDFLSVSIIPPKP